MITITIDETKSNSKVLKALLAELKAQEKRNMIVFEIKNNKEKTKELKK